MIRKLKYRSLLKFKEDKNSDFFNYKSLKCFYNALRKFSDFPDPDIIENIFQILPSKYEQLFVKEFSEKYALELTNEDNKKANMLIDNIFDIIDGANGRFKQYKKFLFTCTMSYLEDYLFKTSINESNDILKNMEKIKNTFRLDDIESEILLIAYLNENCDCFQNFFDCIIENSGRTNAKFFRGIVNISTEFSISEIRKRLSFDGNLIKYELIETGDISIEIRDFIEGISDTALEDKYFSEYNDKTINFEDFCFNESSIEMLKNLLLNKDSNTKILFYGKPGTGKTEFARTLGKTFGYQTMSLKDSFQVKEDDQDRKGKDSLCKVRGILCFENTIKKNTKSLLIIDESDDLLNSEQGSFFGRMTDESKKARINNLLDCTKTFQIWITNKYEGIHESTLRRFDYSLKFPDLSTRQRENIWKNVLKKYNMFELFSSEEIEYLSEKYNTNAGIIDKSVNNSIKILNDSLTKEKAFEIIEDTIKTFSKLKDEDIDNYSIKKPNTNSYSIEGLNVKADIDQTLFILDRFSKALDNDKNRSQNMNLLLWGAPGTGKTEFAKYIARHLKKKLIVKQASDILSCWVGGTEKNIREAFEEAENEKAILLIDEIDSMLQTRDKAQRSWEVSQVNELLSDMEKFKGIFIATTNFITNVDSAATRRFNIKIEFDFLSSEGNLTFYNKYFKGFSTNELTENEIDKIKRLKNLSCGDFKVVKEKFSYYEKDEITNEKLISGLEDELKVKSNHLVKTIGF